ncbi:ash family protein, partial [Shigella flexneri]
MLNVAIENQNGWNYSASAPHKTGAGRGNPNVTRAHSRAEAVFLCVMHSSIQIMVGCAGQSQDWPGSRVTGISTPVRLTTLMVVENLGGELINLSLEDAIMATIPALSHPDVTIENGRAVTTSVAVAEFFHKRHDNVLRAIANTECSPEFNALNFEDVTYTDTKGEKRPMYQITKN